MSLARSEAPAGTDIQPLSDREFDLFRKLILQESGIHLSDAKRALVVGRLTRRLRQLGLTSFFEYYQRLVDDPEGAERIRMLDRISTNETSFFRAPKHFALLEEQIIPDLKSRVERGTAPRRIRVWSAACSTGEEPYSLAMVLCWHLPASKGWDVEISATDLSNEALENAKLGRWPVESANSIPPRYLKRFMRRGIRHQQGVMAAGKEVRSVMRFTRINLADDAAHFGGPFDIIFCRNVLIYFTGEMRRRIVSRMLRHLVPGGTFFLGESEGLPERFPNLRTVGPNVYESVD